MAACWVAWRAGQKALCWAAKMAELTVAQKAGLTVYKLVDQMAALKAVMKALL